MAYSTQTQIEAILGRVLTSYESTMLSAIQVSVDKYIDAQTGVSFGNTPSSKYYDGGNSILAIDPCRSITAVELVNADLTSVYTYVVDQDYIQAPVNDTVKRHLEKRQYFEGVFYDDLDDAGCWPNGLKRIKVTATFSYADTPPDDIAYLASYLMAKYFGANSSAGSGATGDIKKESIEGYSREYESSSSGGTSDFSALNDAVVQSLLSVYQDQEIFF